jgi:predicted RNA binding protein YcfA (HicA-like mRNA interferase family)
MAKTYREVRRALMDAGWRLTRQRGSHEIWMHLEHLRRVVVAGKESDTVPPGTLGSIRRATGLEYLR